MFRSLSLTGLCSGRERWNDSDFGFFPGKIGGAQAWNYAPDAGLGLGRSHGLGVARRYARI